MNFSTKWLFPAGTVLALMLVNVGCGAKNANSFTSDAASFGPHNVSGSAQFLAVNAIVTTSCGQCHSYASYSEADWVSNGYVVPGSPSTSVLMQRLIGSGVPGPQDMPLTGALTSDQIQAISDWITQMSAS